MSSTPVEPGKVTEYPVAAFAYAAEEPSADADTLPGVGPNRSSSGDSCQWKTRARLNARSLNAGKPTICEWQNARRFRALRPVRIDGRDWMPYAGRERSR